MKNSGRLYSLAPKDRQIQRDVYKRSSNYYELSPVGIDYARKIYYGLRRSGYPAWKARHLVWTLVFTTKINLLPMNS